MGSYWIGVAVGILAGAALANLVWMLLTHAGGL